MFGRLASKDMPVFTRTFWPARIELFYLASMKVLALTSYPTEAPATRYRLQQFVAPLAESGITLDIHHFLDSKLFGQLYRQNSWLQTVIGLIKTALSRPDAAFATQH